MIHASLKELAAALAAKTLSSVELTQLYLDRIARLNPELNAFITTDPERSLAAARLADARIAAGQAGPLTGIPIAQKDIFCAEGWRTTCGSKMLENFISPYDATVITRLEREAGMVSLGKANMDEFAMAPPTRLPGSARCKTPGTRPGCPADLPAAPLPLWRRPWHRWPPAPTRAVRSASRPRSAT